MRRLALLLPLIVLSDATACSPNNDEPRAEQPVENACAAFRKTAPPTPVAATCPLKVAGTGSTVRVFAAGNRQDVVKHTTYAEFCESIDRVMREQVAPCLAKDKPNFVVWPEDAILSAAFIGKRAEKARQKSISDAAFLDLAGAYGKQIVHYQQQFASLPAGRNLTLALTDVSFRVLFNVFAAQAKYYGVHVAVGANIAEAREVQDPALRSKLGDPEYTDGPVWEASSPDVYNVGIVFNPDGKIAGIDRKAYLTPPEEDTLNIAYGALPQLDPIDLPFGRASAAISKDAWMPPVRDRFDAWGVELALQYEAFSGWAVEERPGDWNPDVFMESGHLMTARAGSVRNVITPCLTGNILDLVFDCQSHITKIPEPGDTPLSFIGNPKTTGFLAMGPWAAPNWESMSRDELRAYGETLKQGGARENQYAESVAVADLEIHKDGKYPAIPGTGAPGVLGASRAFPSMSPQRHVAVAAHGDTYALAWEETDEIVVASVRGAEAAKLTRYPGKGARLPAIAFDGTGRLALAYEQADTVYVAIGDAAAKPLENKGPQWMPSIAGDPAAARFYVSWIDLRDGGRPHVYLATDDLVAVRVDSAHENTAKPTRGDEWSPRISADATGVHVVWTDFRDYSWDIRYARSVDLGKTFSPSVRVNDPSKSVGSPPVELERLHADPAIAVAATGAYVAWTALQDRRPTAWSATDIVKDGAPAADVALPVGFVQPDVVLAPNARIVGVRNNAVYLVPLETALSDAPPAARAARPRAAALADGTLIVAWEDDRDGRKQIRYVSGKLP